MAARLSVQAFLLADAVYQDRDTGKHIISGTFTRLFAEGFPSTLGRSVSAYCAMLGLEGTVSVGLRFVSPSGAVLMSSGGAQLVCSDPRVLVEFAFPVPSPVLPEAGWYRLELVVDDEVISHLAIEVAVAA